MGPENTSREIGTFCLGGKPIADFAEVDGVLEITALDELAGPVIAAAFGPAAIEAKVSIPKEWRCRSRKRFVKLIMSYGFPRNFANDIARNVRLPGRAYQTALFDTLYFLSTFMGTETN